MCLALPGFYKSQSLNQVPKVGTAISLPFIDKETKV